MDTLSRRTIHVDGLELRRHELRGPVSIRSPSLRERACVLAVVLSGELYVKPLDRPGAHLRRPGVEVLRSEDIRLRCPRETLQLGEARSSRIVAVSRSASEMTSRTRMRPPHLRQRVMSMAKTRARSFAHAMRRGRGEELGEEAGESSARAKSSASCGGGGCSGPSTLRVSASASASAARPSSRRSRPCRAMLRLSRTVIRAGASAAP